MREQYSKLLDVINDVEGSPEALVLSASLMNCQTFDGCLRNYFDRFNPDYQ